MTSPKWVPIEVIVTIHDRQISRHGGASGIRDIALLEMAIARPMSFAAYGNPTLPELAAAYAFGIIKARAFVDGNKRTAFQTAFAFLYLNGLDLHVPEPEVVSMKEGLASSDVTEARFAEWLAAGVTVL